MYSLKSGEDCMLTERLSVNSVIHFEMVQIIVHAVRGNGLTYSQFSSVVHSFIFLTK